VLQAWFAFVQGHACFWDKKSLTNIMTMCVILYNMIIKDVRDVTIPFESSNVGPVNQRGTRTRSKHFLRHIEGRTMHTQLHDDMVEHQWQLYGRYSHNL
jgi:hypothetical protein